MKKQLLLLVFSLTVMTAAAQTNDGMFYYAYDHDTQTATLTYLDTDSKGGTYVGDVVVPAKAPNGYDVTVIGGNAFINSNDMTSLTIPATIDSIGRQPFENCSAHLTKIIIEDGDTPLRCHVEDAWPRGCFPVFGRDVQVEEMYIGRNYHSFVSRGWVEAVYEGSWSLVRDSEYLKTVTMGDVFTEVPYAMFYGCTQLQTVNVSPNVKSVGKEAFWNCESLTDINLPDGVEVIDEEAFGHCKSLVTFDLPSALKLIGARAFLDCDMFSSFTIPASVDSLGVSILDDCDNLKRIDIAYGPTPLKMSCSNQFNNSLRSAPIDTLWTDRYIDGAFSDNRTLKKLYIGSNVEALHDYLFSDCYSVDEVFSLNVVPPTCEGGSVFYSGTKENGTLHVPAESIAAYMQAYVWKDFFNILPIGDFDPGLDKDEEGNYLIASADDWRAFANLTIIEPSANAKMTADIDLGDDQTTVGTQDVPYAGMFDGNGHTLTVAYSQNISGLAPFRYINGATIQKIHITGTIDTQTGKNAAGIVSYSTGGTTTISECWSSAKLKGDDTMGGICAVIQDGTMNINDCLVDGTISGSNAYNGGFISHPDNTATVNINNGLFLRYADADVYWSGTFFRSDQDWFGPRNLYNCYYFYPYGYPQGIQATEEELTDGTLAVALQDGREEQIWGQNTDLNHPVPVVFLTHVAHSTEYETSCDYFDWHGQRYTTSGTYTYEEKNAQGEVTDIYTLELTIHYSTTSSLNMDLYVGDHYATDMYDFTVEKDGETTYYYTTTNAAGCDSVIVLGITILEPQTYETNATINEGESYEWRGNTYTEAGTYTDEVLTEYGGVKEIYILNLTVKEPDPIHYTFDANGHDYVDLGLPTGTLWATCNIGATVPEGMGDFFAWGETEPKDGVYGWTTYKYCNGTQTTQTKYCIDSNYGTVDGKTVLEPEDDAAAVNWGGTWRMPTIEEIQELLDNTTWQETTVNGVRGMKFTSKENDSYIFFPFSGYRDEGNHFGYGERGFYWSNKLLDPNGGGGRLYMWPTNGGVKIYSAGRCHGLSVRGVLGALAQDEEGYYQIASANDWKLFAKLVGTETVVNARMTADIDLGDDQTMVGTVEHPYQGTFDGQGHTLTVNLNSYYTFDIGAVAPFACVKDATIKKLHVAGSLKQQYCAAGGVVGNIQGNLTVSQCWVSAYLYVQGFSNNQGTIGGIASYCDDPAVTDCEIVIEDCIFSGEFGTGIHSGSMMSHVNGGYGNHATLRNCLNIGTFPSASGSSGTFIRPIQGDSFEIDNCFYMNSFGYTQGTHATEEQLANGTTARALQAGRSEQVWVQDLDLGQPMLMVFSKNPDPDGIEEIESLTPALSKGEGAVYDLCGRKLSAGPSTPGLYIVGGKKVMVK
ncbi:MAG: leucine-rich repeat protein [Bacteroidaceae bacterium]|nr:leucine-rich repeat protein [Bacteroidaceae bacterium]